MDRPLEPPETPSKRYRNHAFGEVHHRASGPYRSIIRDRPAPFGGLRIRTITDGGTAKAPDLSSRSGAFPLAEDRGFEPLRA